MSERLTAAVIGAGPAGLMAAEMLADAGVCVDIYEAMPSAGRKFLMAGKSGLNISHTEEIETFLSRYAAAPCAFGEVVREFAAPEIARWMQGLGIEAHEGPTGRLFPVMMKASPLLRAWLRRLEGRGATLHTRHRWRGWSADGGLEFATPDDQRLVTHPGATVFALGGGSWRRLGSDGLWAEIFERDGIATTPFAASNVGLLADWSDHLKDRFAGAPVKSVRLTVDSEGEPISTRAEFVITRRGMESGGIYQLSAPLRRVLDRTGTALLSLDLVPDVSEVALAARLSGPKGRQSMGNFLRKAARLDPVKRALIHEVATPGDFADATALARLIKSLPLRITGTAPLDEAISTAGGVAWDELDEALMLTRRPGTFCAGEMLDWDAPTGGYLITACLATGRRAGQGAAAWLLDRS